ncbi:hypothetical protein EY643_01740 [Halioglobus maricola]|uniref:Uncharacterized protein n=1 Tax=Halioglobus maricola TaxID=2601894 RepID=A0A5P9NHH8_9GAMM|nr:hypothetical protein EY643_01740 [Halioglobus maricola]
MVKRGILYPLAYEPTILDNCRAAIDSGATSTGTSTIHGLLPIWMREPHNALAYEMLDEARDVPLGRIPYHGKAVGSEGIFRFIKQQQEEHSPKTTILCGEVFSNFSPNRSDLIQRLSNHFPDHEVTINCTLRRPDEYIVSWYGQRLKFGHRLKPLRKRALQSHFFRTIHFNYKLLLSSWLSELPDANFQINSYKSVLNSGGAISHFIKQNDLGIAAPKERNYQANISIPHSCYEILRRGNHDLSEPNRIKLKRAILQLEKASISLPSNVELLGPKNRGMLFSRFQHIHDYLCEITGKDSFFADIDEALEIQETPEQLADQTAKTALLGQMKHSYKSKELRTFIQNLQSDWNI